MNKGFTKLEIILGSIILLFTIGFLSTKNLNLSKENLLRQRFNKFVTLLNDKNYSEAYSFYSSSIKGKRSLEDYVKTAKESLNTGKQVVAVNNIFVKDDVGYIDRNNTICEDANCTDRKELRGYKKWIFENNNWYYSPPDPLCLRDKPYDNPPEFSRVLSLIQQRLDKDMSSKGMRLYDFSFFNCLNIQYSDLSEVEGMFLFDPNHSSLEKLDILVKNSYKENDDLLTAFLLSHEVYHAMNYLKKVNYGDKISCIDDEVDAFAFQLIFTQVLNTQEQQSISQRIYAGYYQSVVPLKMISDLWIIKNNADRYCGNNNDCYIKKLTTDIKSTITSNPYYQKQCGLN